MTGEQTFFFIALASAALPVGALVFYGLWRLGRWARSVERPCEVDEEAAVAAVVTALAVLVGAVIAGGVSESWYVFFGSMFVLVPLELACFGAWLWLRSTPRPKLPKMKAL